MTYPLVNGVEINGAQAGQGAGIRAARFGVLRTVRLVSIEGLTAARLGAPQARSDRDAALGLRGLARVRFGLPRVHQALVPGPTTLVLRPLKAARLGMPSAVHRLTVGPMQPLAPVSLGLPLACASARLASLPVVRPGGVRVVGVARPMSLLAARLGQLGSVSAVQMGGVRTGRLGAPTAHSGVLGVSMMGLAAARLGTLDARGRRVVMQPLLAQRLGAPVVRREAVC